MTEGEQTDGEFAAEKMAVDELSILKQRARIMGIVFSNNIGIEALRTKISAKQNEENPSEVVPESTANPLVGETPESLKAKPRTLRQALMEDEMKLIRLRITNMDPKKKDLPGEILTVANEYLGTVCKYIPYGEVTDNGYHVPNCLYTVLKQRKFLDVKIKKLSNGQLRTTHSWVKEFALEELPMLTRADLTKLATAQAAAGIITPNSEAF